MQASQIVRDLDDRTAVRFLEFFGQMLFNEFAAHDIRTGVPERVRELRQFERLQRLTQQERGARLPHSRSALLARALLSYFALTEGTAPLLVEAWSAYEDDSLGGEATLFAGFAEGLVTLAAADGIRVDLDGHGVAKLGASPQLADALAAATLTDAGAKSLAPVELTSFHPTEVHASQWYSLLAYAHVPGARETVELDGKARMERGEGAARSSHTHGNFYIKEGTELTVVPELPGFRFNPPTARFTWLEDWHCAAFRMQAAPDVAGYMPDRAVNGRVSYYVGPVLVGQTPIWAVVSSSSPEPRTSVEAPVETASTTMYQAVFVSYSHMDSRIVDRLESAYEALGLEYLRDVRVLRSGQEWNPELLDKIDEADLFQLCWSRNARGSKYVEQEWRHALDLQRDGFIRPTSWEDPPPKPPAELSKLHFSHLELT